MRILRLDSWDGEGGGAQDYIREVCAELGRRGHENRVINLTTLPAPPVVGIERNLRVRPTSVARMGDDLVDLPRLRTLFDEQLAEFRPDLVQLHHFDAAFTTIGRIVERIAVPVVFTAHDAELVCPISTLVRPGNVICEGGVLPRCLVTGCHVGLGGPYNLWQTQVFDRKVRPKVRAYLCPSRSLTSYLDSNGYRPAVHLPSFARIPDDVHAAPTPAPDPDVPPTVGYLGRLEWYKGVHDLIAALPLLARGSPNVRLDVAGTGPYRPTLEALARRLGVAERVVFRGAVRGAAKEEWFRGVHVVATPSNMWENFPLVALEALARGRPVVATHIGGIPDIVDDGASGRLVPISDPPALAAAIGEFLSDPKLATRWGAEGRRRTLDRYTPEIHLERLIAVYQAVVAGRSLNSGMEAEELRAAA